MRFVPFATSGGSPKKIIKGNVINEPPPATTLIKPAKMPAKLRAVNSVQFNSFILREQPNTTTLYQKLIMHPAGETN